MSTPVEQKPARYLASGGRATWSLTFTRREEQRTETFRVARNRIEVPAGSAGDWSLKINLAAPVKQGGGILLRRRNVAAFACCAQVLKADEEDYARARGPKGVRLRVTKQNVDYLYMKHGMREVTAPPSLLITVEKGALKKGDEVEVTVGGPRRGRHTAVFNLSITADKGRDYLKNLLDVYIDHQADGTFRRCGKPVYCGVIPDRPHRVFVAADSVAVNRKVRLVAKVEDLYGNMCEPFNGKAVMRGPIEEDGRSLSLKGGCGERIVTLKKGVPSAQITVSMDSPELGGTSNRIETSCVRGRQRVYWGEMHGHTNLSHDGQNDTAAAYRFGRDAAGLDFAAVTNHTPYTQPGIPLKPDQRKYFRGPWWTEHQEAAVEHYEPGRYVPILAQEIHPGDGGDHDIYHPRYDSPVVLPARGKRGNVESCHAAYGRLYTRLRQSNTLIVPHVGGGPKDWRYHDPKVETLVEVASGHGNFESFAQAGLQRGYRLGMVYGSDFHCGKPGHSGYISAGGGDFGVTGPKMLMPRMNGSGWCNGTTGILATNLDLSSVLDALWKRRCYACTGRVRPIVNFEINGRVMGSSLRTDGHPNIAGRIAAGKLIRSVHLIRNQSEIARTRCGKTVLDFELVDPCPDPGLNYYYLRAVFADDEIMWTSPIWVRVTGKLGKRQGRPVPWNREEVRSLDSVKERGDALEHKEEFVRRIRHFAGNRFHGFKAMRVVDDSYGPHALFFGLDRERDDAHVRFLFFFEFDRPLIRVGDTWTVFDSRRKPEWGRR